MLVLGLAPRNGSSTGRIPLTSHILLRIHKDMQGRHTPVHMDMDLDIHATRSLLILMVVIVVVMVVVVVVAPVVPGAPPASMFGVVTPLIYSAESLLLTVRFDLAGRPMVAI